MDSLQNLINQFRDTWPFEESEYPGIKGLTGKERELFAIRHILLHQTKAVGILAEIVEGWEHGNDVDIDLLGLTVKRFFKNTLRLAEIAQVSADELIDDCTPSRTLSSMFDRTYG